VGHLRPGIQGWAVKRLMETTGWRVITDNHLGDYGSPFGVWVAGFLRFSSEKALKKDGVYELGRVYIVTKKALKDEEDAGGSELADEVQGWLLKLEKGNKQAIRYRQLFNQISLDHIHSVMKRLKISTDYELGESFYVDKGKKIVEELIRKGVAEKNLDGSVIVPLEGFDVPLLVQKSNGAALYATTDIATIFYREEQFRPDKVIYCVGPEQQFYFSQIFALAKKLGIKTELQHLWWGIIDQRNEDGTREKMSSRKGVVLMEELLDKAETKAGEIVKDRQISDEDIKKIAVGAIKFSDFVADRRTNILFDWDSIFALSGFSGPYVQYAAVRINKILEANKPSSIDFAGYDYESEKSIIAKILEYPEVVQTAARDLEPHKVASYLYELARDMNRYYEKTKVASSSEPTRSARLDVLNKVSYVFSHGLNILGIEVPNQM
jgi:arginyl-tRNA synthetase